MSPTGAGPGARARGPKVAATAVAVVVVLLVAVLVGLLRTDGSPGAGPGTTVGATPSASTSRTARPSVTRSPTVPAATTTTGARDPESGLRVVALADLPTQAQQTVALIRSGGPYPYSKDGATFGNYQRVLPAHARGWYREYTVRTPGEGDRGPRRIVTGDDDRVVFYTADHYATFVRVAT